MVTPEGRPVARVGSESLKVFLRSAAKPFQALPLVLEGGVERWHLSAADLALICASHQGTEAHTERALSLLERAGLGVEALGCGGHWPLDEPSTHALIAAGREPESVHNNCSGKHAGLLLAARHLDQPLDDYLDPGHPLQRRILSHVAEVCAVDESSIGVAPDGCSAPSFRLPLDAAARGYAALADPVAAGLEAEVCGAIGKIVSAMTSHPEMVSGPGTFTTRLMEVTGGRVLGKEGFEGVYAVAVRGPVALGMVMKIADGGERARPGVVLDLLRQLGSLSWCRAGRARGSAQSRDPQRSRARRRADRARCRAREPRCLGRGHRMRVLALEPYYGGSHRGFLDGWRSRSRFDWTLMTLPPYKWKWRMRHSAVTLASEVERRTSVGERWDCLICSDMLNLAELRGLAPSSVASLPSVIYFHENQITYPVQVEKERDFQFGMTNIVSALAADRVWFNSAFHRQAFLGAIPPFLNKMPDHRPLDAVETIRQRSEVHQPGVACLSTHRPGRPDGPLRILWAARWEFDKNPECLFEALAKLKETGVDFRISVLGESFRDARLPKSIQSCPIDPGRSRQSVLQIFLPASCLLAQPRCHLINEAIKVAFQDPGHRGDACLVRFARPHVALGAKLEMGIDELPKVLVFSLRHFLPVFDRDLFS